MTDQKSHSGWVVQVTLPAPLSTTPEASKWIGPAILAAPSFEYYNVAVGTPEQAVEAVRKKTGSPEDVRVHAVRSLSASEVKSIPLKTGEVRPA